jgi:hypothetical protein
MELSSEGESEGFCEGEAVGIQLRRRTKKLLQGPKELCLANRMPGYRRIVEETEFGVDRND